MWQFPEQVRVFPHTASLRGSNLFYLACHSRFNKIADYTASVQWWPKVGRPAGRPEPHTSYQTFVLHWFT